MITSAENSATVLRFNGADWTQIGGSIPAVNIQSLALSHDGNTSVIGAVGLTNVGSFDVWHFNGTQWAPRLGIWALTPTRFGHAVDISADGNIVVVGEPNTNNLNGSVSVWQRVGTGWNQRGFYILGDVYQARFGSSVAISDDGETVVGGATNSDLGDASVYNFDNGQWVLRATITGSATNRLTGGIAISADGTIVAAGGPNNFNQPTVSGNVQIWTADGDQWSLVETLTGGPGARFGNDVAISDDGSSVIINADGGVAEGAVTVWQQNGRGQWVSIKEFTGGYPNFVGISGDGLTVAFIDGTLSDINGTPVFANVIRAFRADPALPSTPPPAPPATPAPTVDAVGGDTGSSGDGVSAGGWVAIGGGAAITIGGMAAAFVKRDVIYKALVSNDPVSQVLL